QLHSALAVLFELEGASQNVSGLFVEMDFEIAARVGLAVPFRQLGFGIEQVHLAGTAVLKQTDDGFRFAGPLATYDVRRLRARFCAGPILGYEVRQSQRPQTAGVM